VALVLDLQLLGRDGGAEHDADFAEKVHFTVLAAVDDAHRQHIRTGCGGNDKGTALDHAKLAGLGAGPLGEDHDARTIFALVRQLFDGGGVALAALDGNSAHAAQEPAGQRIFEQLLLGQNTQPFPIKHRNSDKNRVQIGDVVGCDDIGAPIADGPQILAADDLKPPEDMRQHPDDGQQNPIQKHKQPPQICARIVRFSRSKLSCRPMSLVSTKMASSACFRGATARWLS